MKLQVSAWTDLPVCDDRFGVYKMDEGSLYKLTFCYPYLEYYTNGEWYVRDSFVMIEGTSDMEYAGLSEVSGTPMLEEDASSYEYHFRDINKA